MAHDRSVGLLDELATADPELHDVWLNLAKHAEGRFDVRVNEPLTGEQLAALPVDAQDSRRLAAAFAFHLAD